MKKMWEYFGTGLNSLKAILSTLKGAKFAENAEIATFTQKGNH